MERQQEYISLLSAKLDARLSEGKEEIEAFYEALEPYLTTDMSRGRLINLLWETRDFTNAPMMEMKGVYEMGTEGFMEFYADDAALKELVLELLYTQVQ